MAKEVYKLMFEDNDEFIFDKFETAIQSLKLSYPLRQNFSISDMTETIWCIKIDEMKCFIERFMLIEKEITIGSIALGAKH